VMNGTECALSSAAWRVLYDCYEAVESVGLVLVPLLGPVIRSHYWAD
jgi:hypothetical protein